MTPSVTRLADASRLDVSTIDVLLGCAFVLALIVAARYLRRRLRDWWTRHCCVICGLWQRGPSRGRNRVCRNCWEEGL